MASATASADAWAQAGRPAQLKVVEVSEPDGQILSYRYLAGSMDVQMRGTALAPDATIKLKIGSRPGFVELDINRGGITGLKPAHRFGKDYLTYVLWAVSIDGRASNLGEITFEGERPVPVNVTTPYQTFWLMVTAEPDYAVVDPSPQVVLYSVKHASASENRAISTRGNLFFFTHYLAYESAPGDAPGHDPNHLLQARKAVDLASNSMGLGESAPARGGLNEEAYAREAVTQARAFLARAEDAYRQNPRDQDVILFARTAAQSAENARALAMGAVGGLLVRQLENEVKVLRSRLAQHRTAQPALADEPPEEPTPVEREPDELEPEPVPAPPTPLVKQPALWFAVSGWGLAIVLLFRRRSI